MFSWTEQELDRKQSEAVTLDGSVFLVACPGSGKTRTLTYKIAYELSRLESSKQFVFAITYTHRAADEIRDRIEGLGVDVSRLWIGTIHSFCLEWIIKPYGIYEPALAFGYKVIDQHDRETLLERLCANYKNSKVKHFDCDYYFKEDHVYLSCQDTTKHSTIHKILSEYFEDLSENRRVDFEMILWYASRLVKNHAAICTILSKMVSIVLVDEYQDTKHIQYCILGAILKAGGGATRLFMVGDPNQAIYGSLGGYPIEIEALKQMTGLSIFERELPSNYRSSERIVGFFGNFNVHNTTINPDGLNRAFPSIVSYNRVVSRDNLVHSIAGLIRRHVEQHGIPQSEICVLGPQWIPLASMTRQLVSNMPDYQFNGPGLVPFARDTENFWYKLSRLALTDPSPSQYVRRFRWAGDVITDMSDAGVEMACISRKILLQECNSISIDEPDGLNYLKQFYKELFARLGIDFSHFAQLTEHYESFFASSQSRVKRLQDEGIGAVGDLAYFRKIFQNSTGITVSTIHGVKGAEFDVVIAYALLEGMVPFYNDPDGDRSAQKLLYVIGSRARKHLHLFSETGRPRGRYGTYGPTTRLASCSFNYDSDCG